MLLPRPSISFIICQFYVEADLMEINGGYWEGGPWNEFSTLYPEDYDYGRTSLEVCAAGRRADGSCI